MESQLDQDFKNPEVRRRDEIAHGGYYTRKNLRKKFQEAELSPRDKHISSTTVEEAERKSYNVAQFEFLIELDSEDLKLGIDGYSQGNITINGEYGSISSEYTMMIFVSLSLLLYGIKQLASKEIEEYKFVAVEGGFSFYLTNTDNIWVLTDKKNDIIAESSLSNFVQSIWRGVNEFQCTYKPLIEEVDVGIKDFEESVEDFRTQFSEILNYSEKSIKD